MRADLGLGRGPSVLHALVVRELASENHLSYVPSPSEEDGESIPIALVTILFL